jgi:hypothetical protein
VQDPRYPARAGDVVDLGLDRVAGAAGVAAGHPVGQAGQLAFGFGQRSGSPGWPGGLPGACAAFDDGGHQVMGAGMHALADTHQLDAHRGQPQQNEIIPSAPPEKNGASPRSHFARRWPQTPRIALVGSGRTTLSSGQRSPSVTVVSQLVDQHGGCLARAGSSGASGRHRCRSCRLRLSWPAARAVRSRNVPGRADRGNRTPPGKPADHRGLLLAAHSC